jgi:ubiquinone/menaquinone biosynthesis C-methylase UbiE
MDSRSRSLLLLVVAVVALTGCTWFKVNAYEGFGRDGWQKPDEVIEALALAPGDTVADLGSGSGYFSVRLANAVPEGKLYAVDVDEEMNERLRKRFRVADVTNAEIVLASPDDPKLPDGEIDLVFTANTYHHLRDRPAYFRRLQADLSPRGRVAVLEFDGRKGWFVKLQGHFTPKDELIREMTEAGYEVVDDHTFLDRQSFIVFRPKS